ncbi:hypothetical protein ACJMK2_041116 [Sinanodonta woodiana]|uniref:Uncharacterized protein n=1 Tax=Sinanodonta woodiana TaxID=1069815 RepID=A0ABD3W414_SINWO
MMPLSKYVYSLTPTTTKQEVPILFHEPHVETGFRKIHQPWSYYLLSLFQRHNECMNAWTHLIALLFCLAKFKSFSEEFDLINDPFMLPLVAGIMTTVMLYLCSFSAHCFHNQSELMHYTWFMIDYAGIGMYGLGCTILHYSYSLDQSLIGGILHDIAVPAAVCLAVTVCVCCSISKVMYKRPYPFTRKIWQISSVGGIYILLIIPILQRIYLSIHDGEKWDSGLSHHTQQILWFLSAGFFFGSDIPQRFFPGKFDFVGHSHQIFHVCIMMTTFKKLDAVYEDIRQNRDLYQTQLPIPSFMGTIGAVLLATLMNVIVVSIFHQLAKSKLLVESKKKK